MTDFSLETRISHWNLLGQLFDLWSNDQKWPGHECGLTEIEYEQMYASLHQAELENPWFAKSEISRALSTWSKSLSTAELQAWLASHPQVQKPKKVAIIMAGNIPLVGLHDLLSVSLSGHHALVKPSSQDKALMMMVIETLYIFDETWRTFIDLVDGKLSGHEAIIATGSDNSARYFHHYFGGVPNIIRKNRSSIAVLHGHESKQDIEALGQDIFAYFGLGCRSISKIYLPNEMNIDLVFEGLFSYQAVVHHNKYANNYDYHRALFLMNEDKFLDNGFIMLRESKELHSPVGCLFYERYQDLDELKSRLKSMENELQCIVGLDGIELGESQAPALDDYADGVDTLRFLQGI